MSQQSLPNTTPRRPRVLARALGALVLFAAFIAAGVWISQVISAGAVTDTGGEPGIDIVVRTPQHLQNPSSVEPLIERFAARGVSRAWVLAKQDESNEYLSGTALYPSTIAPVARGYEDDRFGRLINGLAGAGIAPLAWLPTMIDEQAARAHPAWRSLRVREDGEVEQMEQWLCPFSDAAVQYQASLAAELAKRYSALEGLYLDFIRFDDDFACVCTECLEQLDRQVGWETRTGRPLVARDIRDAADRRDPLWNDWIALRADKIAEATAAIRDAVRRVRPDLPVGAFVLPFSSPRYEDDSNSGQDFSKMASAGLDEFLLMGYWDDWGTDPNWVAQKFDGLVARVGKTAAVRLVLDGDMGVRRTRLTLEALEGRAQGAAWFNYDAWSAREFDGVSQAVDARLSGSRVAQPEHLSVVIRIDTEPDYQNRYDTVHPSMINDLVRLFEEEEIPATFMTVGQLAQQQANAIRSAARAGHEIASHAQEHLQLDDHSQDVQLAAVTDGVATLRGIGVDVHGFGAPRNSGTDAVRDRLIDLGLEYDGSESYDPTVALVDVHYAPHSAKRDQRIVVVPFIEPNDWDARRVVGMSPEEMTDAWTTRLDLVAAGREPVFVLDIHQWLITEPANLEALREFIRHAKACGRCRIETLRSAASHARMVLDRYELEPPTTDQPARTPTTAEETS